MSNQKLKKVPACEADDDAHVAAVRVLRQFRIILKAVKAHFAQMEKRAGIGGVQIWALSVVQARPGVGVSELAVAIDVRQPTASNMVSTLVALGFIEVRKQAADKRAVQLYLRAPAKKLLRRVPGPYTGLLPDAIRKTDTAVLLRLERDLRALILNLDVSVADASASHTPLSESLHK